MMIAASGEANVTSETLTREDLVHVGSLDDLKARGRMVVKGRRCPLLVVHDQGQVYALDNRCPHLGFPLYRGTVQDGILTCHWHHARFDLASGGTFDLWADDVPIAEVRVEGGEVWVAAECRVGDPAAHWRRRLRDGMAHNLALVIAKSVLGARSAGVADAMLVRDAALFGARHRDGFGIGMTILVALANLLPMLPDEEAYLALFQGMRRVAMDCEGEPARRDRAPLVGASASMPTLERWFRQWTEVRHRDAAERTLLTAIDRAGDLDRLAAMMLAAVTDRPFADGGHALDFVNKAFECVDLIGSEHASAILPTVVGQLVAARGADETNAWRHPVDLVPLMAQALDELPRALTHGRPQRGRFEDHAGLAEALLVEDPAAISAALLRALGQGALPHDLGRALAYAGALRIARFGTANEFSDWDTALHGFTYANALHQLLRRVSDQEEAWPLALRGVWHGAMALWLSRYLNQPPARLPDERRDRLDELPRAPEELRALLLDAFDRQQQVNPSARLVARYLSLGHPLPDLIATLAHALLREDAGFHTYQMFEAAIRQYREWGDGVEGRTILIALTRYLAAHCPTERARYQTATIARRLHRGGKVHEDEPEAQELRA
jgi:nitrite reductase/ring-hydroxylating ferredoxin subunit